MKFRDGSNGHSRNKGIWAYWWRESSCDKTWLGLDVLQLIKAFTTQEKENAKWQKDSFRYLVTNANCVTIE